MAWSIPKTSGAARRCAPPPTETAADSAASGRGRNRPAAVLGKKRRLAPAESRLNPHEGLSRLHLIGTEVQDTPAQNRSGETLLHIAHRTRLSAVATTRQQAAVHLDSKLQIDVREIETPAADRLSIFAQGEYVLANRLGQTDKLDLRRERVGMIDLESHSGRSLPKHPGGGRAAVTGIVPNH